MELVRRSSTGRAPRPAHDRATYIEGGRAPKPCPPPPPPPPRPRRSVVPFCGEGPGWGSIQVPRGQPGGGGGGGAAARAAAARAAQRGLVRLSAPS